ncbi:MAG: hypothetical protein OES19_02845 [Nitrosopumilus sp.]|nr:hypothetical protein [Nitrosopumilus sp.]
MDKENVKKIMNCPKCDAILDISDDASVGEIVFCPNCGADFEIAKKDGSNLEIKQMEIDDRLEMSDAGDEP